MESNKSFDENSSFKLDKSKQKSEELASIIQSHMSDIGMIETESVSSSTSVGDVYDIYSWSNDEVVRYSKEDSFSSSPPQNLSFSSLMCFDNGSSFGKHDSLHKTLDSLGMMSNVATKELCNEKSSTDKAFFSNKSSCVGYSSHDNSSTSKATSLNNSSMHKATSYNNSSTSKATTLKSNMHKDTSHNSSTSKATSHNSSTSKATSHKSVTSKSASSDMTGPSRTTFNKSSCMGKTISPKSGTSSEGYPSSTVYSSKNNKSDALPHNKTDPHRDTTRNYGSTKMQWILEEIVSTQSSAFHHHPLIGLLRDLEVTNQYFTQFRFNLAPLIAGIPKTPEKLIEAYLCQNPLKAVKLYQPHTSAVDSVMRDAVAYSHAKLIVLIEGRTYSASLKAEEDITATHLKQNSTDAKHIKSSCDSAIKDKLQDGQLLRPMRSSTPETLD